MERRNFIKAAGLTGVITAGSFSEGLGQVFDSTNKPNHRANWLKEMDKMLSPVFSNLAQGTLKQKMPFESQPGHEARKGATYLEAFGRSLAGIAPWLTATVEGQEATLQKKYREWCLASLSNIFDPKSTDYVNIDGIDQGLVDSAFVAEGILRAPEQLWNPLSEKAKSLIIDNFFKTRKIKPHFNNWLLFSGIIEAFLLKFTGEADHMRIDYALKKHEDWFKGDGTYGDGPDYHWDYYNSFVIQPMLIEISEVLVAKSLMKKTETPNLYLTRAKKYAEVLERMIAPDGTFPALGRSIVYRTGVFHLLSLLAWKNLLPTNLKPSQVRNGLTAVLNRSLSVKDTYTQDGWLKIGFAGSQLKLGEVYITTGSLYLASFIFLPLGLPESDPFWADAPLPWSGQEMWQDFRFKP